MNDPLDSARFAWTATKDGRVLLSFEGRRVVTLTGKKAATFLACIEDANPRRAQLLMARATGNFKRRGR